ncbi:MAG: hypothetical protein RLN89_09660 [Parvibaculum sp.]
MEIMDACEFYRRYGRPAIELDFRWQHLSVATPIDITELSSREEIECLLTAWYTPQEDERTDFLDGDKHNITLGEVVSEPNLVRECHRNKIEYWTGELGRGTATLSIPAYALPDSKYLLLDGNHRAVAALQLGLYPLVLHVVKGVVSRHVLADLWRWDGGGPYV